MQTQSTQAHTALRSWGRASSMRETDLQGTKSEEAKSRGAEPEKDAVALRREIDGLRSELAQVHDVLAAERANHRVLIEGLPLYVFHKDLELRHVYVSENLARKLGRTPIEMEGQRDVDLSPGLGEKYQADDTWVIETGQVFEDYEEHTPIDGEPTYVQTRKMPMRNARGEIVGVQGWLFDVTPIKTAELALQARSDQLEKANALLHENQAQLLASEKMASLGRLTAGIAHEMNTPLAAVRSALSEVTELVAEYQRSLGDSDVTIDDHKEIGHDMEKSLTLAKNAAARASAFVRGIKSQTRNMTGQIHVDFDAVVTTNESLLLLAHLVRSSKCELVFETALQTFPLVGIPGRLAQVVTNLVTNAADALKDKGGGRIEVGMTVEPGGLCLMVKDNGTGIPVELQQKIFEPMFTTKPFGEGTGLGLSIVNDIVTAEFGGRIELHSESGKGTTFLIHLPVREGKMNGA